MHGHPNTSGRRRLPKLFVNAARRFSGASGGNVAVLFAFLAIPIIGLMGGAVDFGRASLMKVKMQNALDATSIMLAKEASAKSTGQLNTDANTFFNTQFKQPEVKNLALSLQYTPGDQLLTLNGSASLKTKFIGIVGIDSLAFGGSSTVKWGTKGLQVALVLDNTGSMASNGKLTALKSATNNFLDKLKAAASSDGDVYVSIIPFAKDVNFGASNYNASWIDWTAWDSSCSNQGWGWGGGGWGGGGWGHCTPPSHSTWTGCIMDRGNTNGPSSGNYDTNVVTPTTSNSATLYVAEDYSDCPQAAMGLSYNWSAMKNVVNNMVAAGNTNQGLGLQAGWLSLTGGGPFTVPTPPDPTAEYGKAIIILSDGLNTEDRWYSNANQIDARQQKTCDNIKAAGVTLYTIQVNTSHDPTSTLLQNCASDPSKFYLLNSSGQILGTLSTIAAGLDTVFLAH
jgi:Flp pilus assembly protein TadG